MAPRELRRARRAVRPATRVRHPNLCAVRGVISDGVGGVEVDTDAPVGGAMTLRQLVARHGPLTRDQVKLLVRDVCGALHAAHRRGVVHGAVTCDSVLVLDDRFVLADLGEAQLAAGRRDDVSERDDVYCVGALLYEALTGSPPFAEGVDSLPAGVRGHVLRCLQRDASRRFANMVEVADAIGVPLATASGDTRPRRSGLARVALVMALVVAAGGGFTWWRAQQTLGGAEPAAAAVAAARAAATAAAAQNPTPSLPVVAVRSFEDRTGDPEHAWLAAALRELTWVALHEEPSLRVAAAGASVADAYLDATLSLEEGALWVEIELYDVASGALRLAERVPVKSEDDLMNAADALLVPVRRSLGGRDAATVKVSELTTDSAAAWRAYLAGRQALDGGDPAVAESGFLEAARLDDDFFHPRAALVDIYERSGRRADAAAALAQAEPLAARAGSWGGLTLRRLAARTPADRVAAMRELTARYPEDSGAALDLARAHAALGAAGAADCAREAARALALDATRLEAYREVAWCSLAAGQLDGAIAAAEAYAAAAPRDALAHLTLGDVYMQTGKYGSARLAYGEAELRGAAASATAGTAMAMILGGGKCDRAMQLVTKRVSSAPSAAAPMPGRDAETLAVAWAYSALVCGDAAGIAAAARWLRDRDPGSRVIEELELWRAVWRREAGSFDRAVARAADETLWAGGAADRSRRWLPVLLAARSEKRAADALDAFGTAAPSDRYAVMGAPLSVELALTRLAAGDATGATAACAEIQGVTPRLALVDYCLGRVAQAEGNGTEAFRRFRDFLDRWAEAGAGNVWFEDAQSRLRQVIQDNRSTRG